jgi:hypothetical protein
VRAHGWEREEIPAAGVREKLLS